jgi:hypothetical protein
MDHCESSPCAHGVCESTDTGYECTCATGWTGDNCDEGTLLEVCCAVIGVCSDVKFWIVCKYGSMLFVCSVLGA